MISGRYFCSWSLFQHIGGHDDGWYAVVISCSPQNTLQRWEAKGQWKLWKEISVHVGWFTVSPVMSRVLFDGLGHTWPVGLLCREEFPLGQGRDSALKHLVLLGWVVLAELLGRSGLCSLSLLQQELQDVLFSAHTKAWIEMKAFLNFESDCSRWNGKEITHGQTGKLQ